MVLKASDDIATGWNNVFLLSALVSLVGGQLFLVFGSGKNQNYGAPQRDTNGNLDHKDSKDEVFINDCKQFYIYKINSKTAWDNNSTQRINS